MEFDVQVRAGNGDTFKVFLNEGMKVSELHEKISQLFACAPSAVRLVYKSKVLSHKPAETLGSFGITPGEKPKPMLQLVVVRDGAAPKVEPPKPKPAAQTQKAGSWRSRRASG